MSIYISHLYVEFYVELDINVGVVSFDLIYMIFDEKLLIGKSVDFLWIFVFVQEESGLNFGFGIWV